MTNSSRRGFLRNAVIAGATLAADLPVLSGSPWAAIAALPEIETLAIPLKYWRFRFDPDDEGERQGWYADHAMEGSGSTPVSVPHAWQILPEKADYQGVAWYGTTFEAPTRWAGKTVRVEFEAVYHSAKVWLNGKLLGEHNGKGYTAFRFDATPSLRLGGPNHLTVRVNNSYADGMLPRKDSFDWAQDGGSSDRPDPRRDSSARAQR